MRLTTKQIAYLRMLSIGYKAKDDGERMCWLYPHSFERGYVERPRGLRRTLKTLESKGLARFSNGTWVATKEGRAEYCRIFDKEMAAK